MPQSKRLEEVLAEQFPYQEAIIDRGVLYMGTKAILYGKYKAMKSMLTTKLGLCVANGDSWLGFNTPKGGMTVLYVQLEIPKRRMKARLQTLAKSTPTTKQGFHVWTIPVLKLDEHEGLVLLEQEIIEVKPQLLILDPVYKIMKGDMLSANAIQSLLDNVDYLMSRYDMSAFLVSHTRKGIYEEWGSDDLIGSVIFSAWADSIIKVERDGKRLTVKFEVVRHAEEDIEPVDVLIEDELKFEPVARKPEMVIEKPKPRPKAIKIDTSAPVDSETLGGKL